MKVALELTNAGQGSAEFDSKPRGCNKLEDK